MISKNIYFVQKGNITELSANQVTIEQIGGKAIGLFDVPDAWSVPFFIVSKEMFSEYLEDNDISRIQPYIDNILKVIKTLKFSNRIILRSSAVDEGMSERGRFDSVETCVDNLDNSLLSLLERLKWYAHNRTTINRTSVYWTHVK